ncbi:hypothetical protein MAPG_11360 [Magnaporthiopsis poae ATCC 64411]|uniref:Polyketide synthase n=1 Tax=Magnaporthiopsis poae (strain ATCC 64411 / 73-15) TaxID=644358 RepID=A0A0C4EF25_MAGP6|nr:hypothetical protein MAPG_11360 [Magnaporthiopsis poae ATCC 64411]
MRVNSDTSHGGIEPIAIVGMSCRLPGGIDSASSLWETIKEKRSVQTPKVPANRFNIDAYLHENLERPGSFNVPGGYFLDGNLEDFDPSFFGISPVEAMWLDPQQRKMLEVTYECFEAAGASLESMSGSNTGVFVGCFTNDFQQMAFRESDFRHSYAATGVDPGIISTRLGNVFDLRGPNATINTACSSAIYAVHQACNALRARDCYGAVAGGVNLVMVVDQHLNTAKLGVLSPTAKCHTFDASADGYGRGEGVGALYLKRLSDAMRDGDPVRAVIRGSAVNSNGKVPGYGITYPSIRGQEAVVRAAYARCGLDPADTAYVECHGTGTNVGDPIETQAIATAMNDTRPRDKPLVVGAIKPNIGHSEAASGIFAVMKAALQTENGVITGIHGFKTINPGIHEEEWNIKVPRDTAPWPENNNNSARRAGVSSFGYGGTNGHVIIEQASAAALARCPMGLREPGRKPTATGRPFLVGFSAHDRRTLERNVAAHTKVAADYHLPDLAYTLFKRRSRFAVRGFAVVTEEGVAETLADPSALTVGTAPASVPEVGFVFTGQGAQWAALGASAMDVFPSFLATVRSLDDILQGLRDPALRPLWSLENALRQPAGKGNRINDADVAQPICTAVQIAIVDLFAGWGIQPNAVVGHSSGEIAAAYAAGFISAPEAMVAAYLRGYAVTHHAPVGSMLAVGLSPRDAQPWLEKHDGNVVVACQNSPVSTTLSGTTEAITALAEELNKAEIFARELPTGKAYHSHHMVPVGQVYDSLLSKATSDLSEADKAWRRPRITWVSSVTGAEFTDGSVDPKYWSRNLCSRVLFDEAVVTLCKHHALDKVKAMVEIGPHPALSGPFKQTCQGSNLTGYSYTASLVRNKNSAEQLVRTAGALFLQNYPVDVLAVNSLAAGKPEVPKLLVDLPPYQWNYEKTYWAESRFSAEQRHPTHGRHDLLGSRLYGLSERAMAWKNCLRHEDLPWLKDHKLGGEDIFPAAAHLSMAAEALWQVCDNRGVEIESVTFRDVVLSVALSVPETDGGIETQLRLDYVDDDWFRFSVQSWADGEWNVHCEGLSRYLVHPSTIDGCLHLVLISINAGHHREMPNGVVPIRFEEVTIWPQRAVEPFIGQGVGWLDEQIGRHFHSGMKLVAPSGETILDGRNMICISYEAAVPSDSKKARPREPYMQNVWRPDVSVLTSEQAARTLPSAAGSEINTVAELVSLAEHKKHPGHAVILGYANDAAAQEELLHGVPATTSVVLAAAEPELDLGDLHANLSIVPAADGALASPHDLAIVGKEQRLDTEFLQKLAAHMSPNGRAVFVTAASDAASANVLLRRAEFSGIDIILACSDSSVIMSTYIGPVTNGHVKDPDTLLVLRQGGGSSHVWDAAELYGEATVLERDVSAGSGMDKAAADLGRATKIIIDDTAGNLLLSLTEDSFELLKAALTRDIPVVWVTKGVNQGSAVTAAMSLGLLRVVRSEYASAQIVWLDVDADEEPLDVSRVIASQLEHPPAKNSNADTEFWLHEGILQICRVVSNEPLNQQFAASLGSGQPFDTTLPTNAMLRGKVVGHEVVFSAEKEEALGESEVRLQVEHASQQGRLTVVSGTITTAHTGLRGAVVGRKAVAFTSDAFKTSINLPVDLCVFMPDDHDPPSTVAAIPSMISALNALKNLANVESGEHVLVLASPQASSTVAAIAALVKWLRFRLTIVTRTEAERATLLHSLPNIDSRLVAVADDARAIAALLEQKGEEADVVVATEFTTMARDTWRSIPAGGRFILDGGVIENGPDAVPFSKGASFFTTGLDKLFRRRPVLLATLAREALVIMDGEGQGASLVGSRPVLLDISAAAEPKPSVGQQQHQAPAVVLHYNCGVSKIKMQPTATAIAFSPDVAYLLVGCLGGLGRSLTAFMMERGARDFVFLSRSGADKPEAAQLIKTLQSAGARPSVYRGDAANKRDVERVVSEVSRSRPVKGVVHAAMVLQDTMFEGLTLAQYQAAVGPKAHGAQALHEALEGHDLDFFVMTSSISATMGNPGQANYSAGNSYLDALAWHRNRRGLPAVSLVLPAVLGVGVVAENEALETSLAKKAMYGVDEREMLRGFETAMLQPKPSATTPLRPGDSQIILGLEPAFLAAAIREAGSTDAAYWYGDARFGSVRAVVEDLLASDDTHGSSAGGGNMVAALSAAGPDGAVDVAAGFVIKKLSAMLMVPLEEFEMDNRSVGSYGLDSMVGAELRNWLFNQFGLQMSFQQLLGAKMSVRVLAQTITEHLAGASK